eukprot:3797906-Prymnesium_polylepis.1
MREKFFFFFLVTCHGRHVDRRRLAGSTRMSTGSLERSSSRGGGAGWHLPCVSVGASPSAPADAVLSQ